MRSEITPTTRLSAALALDPRVVDYIVSLNPHDFQRLYNPLMRRFMAPRITLGRVAAMVDMPVAELLQRIADLGSVTVGAGGVPTSLPASPTGRPLWVEQADPASVVEVNLLPIDATLDVDPLPPVITAVKALAPGGVLRIRHMWEPQPLYDVWAKMGRLAWYSEQIGPNEWWIWVRRDGPDVR